MNSRNAGKLCARPLLSTPISQGHGCHTSTTKSPVWCGSRFDSVLKHRGNRWSKLLPSQTRKVCQWLSHLLFQNSTIIFVRSHFASATLGRVIEVGWTRHASQRNVSQRFWSFYRFWTFEAGGSLGSTLVANRMTMALINGTICIWECWTELAFTKESGPQLPDLRQMVRNGFRDTWLHLYNCRCLWTIQDGAPNLIYISFTSLSEKLYQ